MSVIRGHWAEWCQARLKGRGDTYLDESALVPPPLLPDVLRKLGMSSPRSKIPSKLGGAGPTHRRYSRQKERDLLNVES